MSAQILDRPPNSSSAFMRGHSRRFSSGSASLSATKPHDSNRPTSAHRSASKSAASQPTSNDSHEQTLSDRRQPSTSKRFSTASAWIPDSPGKDGTANANRLSQSTISSVGTSQGHHRRHSSFSKRFSFGANTFNQTSQQSPPNSYRLAEPAGTNYLDMTLAPLKPVSPIVLPNLSPSRSPDLSSAGVLDRKQERPNDDKSGRLPPQKRSRDQIPRNLSGIAEKSAPALANTRPRIPSTNDQSRPRQVSSPSKGSSRHANQQSKDSSQGSSAGGSEQPKRSQREKEKKAMLSKALQRANEAVLLDNEQNYSDAVSAYQEACNLLNQVMGRSSSDDDKRKLTAIRSTYMTRIEELQQITVPKPRPTSRMSNSGRASSNYRQSMQPSLDGVLEMSPNVNPTGAWSYGKNMSRDSTPKPLPIRPGRSSIRRESANISSQRPASRTSERLGASSRQSARQSVGLAPRSVTPSKRSISRDTQRSLAVESNTDAQDFAQRESGIHGLVGSRTGSWFNPIDDDVASSPTSSHHSVSSAGGMHRRDLRNQTLDTEAEFDAALDAAVEAAYNDGYEPVDETQADASSLDPLDQMQQRPSHRHRRSTVEEARTYAEREDRIRSLKHHTSLNQRNQKAFESNTDLSDGGSGIDSDEEERLLEQVTTNFSMEPITSDPTTSTVPRTSDSSGFSGRTGVSSVASSLNTNGTAGTSLSTVDENSQLHSRLPKSALTSPPPTQTTLPSPPVPRLDERAFGTIPPVSFGSPLLPQSPGFLRERRSQNPKTKQLKIETHIRAPSNDNNDNKISPTVVSSGKLAAPGNSLHPQGGKFDYRSISSPYPSPYAGGFPADARPPIPTTPVYESSPASESIPRSSPKIESPPRPTSRQDRIPGEKAASILGISKHVLLANEQDGNDVSPGTPFSLAFSTSIKSMSPQGRSGTTLTNPLNTPSTTLGFANLPLPPSGKISLFDHEMHSSLHPGQPNPDAINGPQKLEPCPESNLLRPFWLMRCFKQTLVHSKGGYVTTRLFVPHDAWKVKNVKLKGVEEKIACCDLLTAALVKFSAVDTLDAEAVLQEMQDFESVLDQAQSNLTKKLGSDVGVQGIASLFKDASPGAEGPQSSSFDPSQGVSGNKSSSKSYLSSWRKLRNKNSTPTLTSAPFASTKEMSKENTTTMNSVPMTSMTTSSGRGATMKRQASEASMIGLRIDGPNSSYAGALARLCDAAQVLDQVVRQVEDPGLRASSSTHVGLELCARHAAEFFGFYVCRFVLQDLVMLMDKFLKRASEWVLS